MGPAASRMRSRARQRALDGRGVPARLTLLVVVLAVWEWYGHQVSAALFVPPSAIVRAFYDMAVVERTLLDAVGTTVVGLVAGLGAAVVVGVAVGVALGRWRLLGQVVDPYVAFFYSMPLIALQPLLIVWLGIGSVLKIAMVFAFSVFVVIINTAAGVREVEDTFLDVGRSMCATETQVVRTIILPRALPYIMTGIRLGLAQGLVGVIVVEMTAAVTGMGGLVVTAGSFFQTARLFVPILVIMLVSVVLTAALRWLHRKVSPWAQTGHG
ncbi:MAG: ABC transporter permease subunit [Nitriliruptorales bacterium]|nr:ABC transporter permease subunit [Nitriliruptorales bacterium]